MRGFPLSAALVLVLCAGPACAKTIRVTDSHQLRQALGEAKPGDRIELLPGDYKGEMHYYGLKGAEGRPIVVTAAVPELPPVITGGGEGLKLSCAAHVELSHLVIQRAAFNGINVDDGGDPKSPSHHLHLHHLTVRDVGTTGNDDSIKFSGVTDFVIEHCAFERWGREGQGVDLTGCHRGRVADCRFDGQGVVKVGLQMKGASTDLQVVRCSFRGITDRIVHLGGASGPTVMRPGPAPYEAKDLLVEDCTFVGAEAPFAFVNVDGAVVRRNVVYRPNGWVIRILQEITGPGMVPCRHGRFLDNVVVWRSDELTRFVDAGRGTAPETFEFAGNFWYCLDRPGRSRPRGLPTPERDGVYGQNPVLAGPHIGDLTPGRSREAMRAAFAGGRMGQSLYALAAGTGGLFLVSAATALGLWRQFGRHPGKGPAPSPSWKTAPPAPQRVHFAAFLVVWLGLLTYAAVADSAPPALDSVGRPPSGGRVAVRVDWANHLLLFLPVGLCGCAVAALDRPGRRDALRTAAAVAVACLVVVLGLEAIPGRASDGSPFLRVVARLAGCLVGGAAWFHAGPTAVRWLRDRLPARRAPGPVDWLLGAYTAALLLYSVSPFNLIEHPREAYFKFRSGQVNLVPFATGAVDLAEALVYALAFVPVGAWAATVWTSPRQPVRSPAVAALVGLAVAALIEAGHLIVWDHACDVTRILLGAAGALLGAALMRGWGERLLRPARARFQVTSGGSILSPGRGGRR